MPDISLQLYTLRDELAKGFFETCQRVHNIGYLNVELAGFHGFEPDDLRKRLNNLGLSISGSHVGPEAVLEEAAKTIEIHQALGCKDVTVPHLPEKYRSSREQWIETGKALNDAAIELASHGIRLSYHNHTMEFDRVDDSDGWTLLFSNAPNLGVQLDICWAQAGGRDPASLVRSAGSALRSVHVKDVTANGKDIEWGKGKVDRPAVLKACLDVKVPYLVVETDKPSIDPFESVRFSLNTLKNDLDALN